MKEVKLFNNKPESTNTYYVRLEADHFWRFDTRILDNADDSTINTCFESNDLLCTTIAETVDLYKLQTWLDDLDLWINDEKEEQRNAYRKLNFLLGNEHYVETSNYFADPESIKLTLVDENGNELKEIDYDCLPYISAEQGRDDLGDDEELTALYLCKNNIKEDYREHAFPMPKEGEWCWVNVQKCVPDSSPVLIVKTNGNFDVSKLAVKQVLVEDYTGGLMSIDMITEILYDGVILEPMDLDIEWDKESINLFIKASDDKKFPEKVYDFTNQEES